MDRVTLPQYQLKWGGGFDPSEKKKEVRFGLIAAGRNKSTVEPFRES